MKSTLKWLALALLPIAFFVVNAANQKITTKTVLDTPTAVATFAGGCFWCTESGFEHIPGVFDAISGYTGGKELNPTYKQVSRGVTGHIESVKVIYDPAVITYQQLLDAFWRMVNPTDSDGQFVDRGEQYTTAIFYHDEAQKRAAEQSKAALMASGRYSKEIITPIRPAGDFYNAEEYHQNYYKKNPVHYKFYRYNSGRDQYLEKTWGDELHLDFAK